MTDKVKGDDEQKNILDSLKIMAASEGALANDFSNEELSPEKLKNVVESIIFASKKAISVDKIAALFPQEELADKSLIREAIAILQQDYQSRGVELIEVSSGFRFQVAKNIAPLVVRLWDEKPQKYSRALLETLALIAYRQPITRGEIEEIRGVSVSSQIMRTLVEREWVRIIGHRDVPGKPAMYATTRQFLDYFNLKKLDELPTLDEIRDLDVINEELDFGDANTSDETSKAIDIEGDSETTQETIDIDEELQALSETYQQLDKLKEQSLEEKMDENSIENNDK